MLLATTSSWPVVAAVEPPDPDAEGLTVSERFEALTERIRYEQARLETLEAAFVQRKESELLLEPEVSRGTFSYRAPDQIRWDFDSPNDMVVVLRDQEMLTWYRDLGRAERVDVGRQADRVLQLLGPGSSLETLQRYFTLTATFPKTEGEPYRLKLDPSFPRVKKRIRSMTLHVDRETFVPVFVRYVDADGNATELTFEDVRVNGGIPDGRFDPELPEDVEVTSVDLGG